MPDVVVDRIDRYEILAELGRGATGVVYRAHDPELDRLVAIKTLRPARDLPAEQAATLQRRLRSEATAVARLNHPNIVAIHDMVVWRDTPCVVMEYVEGSTLADLITRGPLVPARAIHIALQVCDALEYAHALGVVHRDIKPGNILVSATGVAKLGDFSMAPRTGQDGGEATALVGTPGYMAPEEVMDGTRDTRSDLFSLGVVLYEAVAGVRAFPGVDLASVLHDVAHVEPASPREYNVAVTPGLAAVIRQAMSKQPGSRYASARVFGQALIAARDASDVAAGTGALWPGRGALIVALVGLAIAGSSGGSLEVRRSVAPRAQAPAAAVTAADASVRPRRAGQDEVRRPVESATRGSDASGAIPRPERVGRRAAVSGAPEGGQAAGRSEGSVTVRRASEAGRSESPVPVWRASEAGRPEGGAVTVPRASEAPETAASPQRLGCLSVNAVPFATVLVDGQVAGETPEACLRVKVGEHRIQLLQDGDRSPERVVRVGEQHTAENPVRLSFDFRARRFGE
jgi:tRNA A-37 threonylcarbamoyl transferase component Bud32